MACANLGDWAMRYAAVLLAVLSTGCMEAELRRNTVSQAWTVGDVYEQQVMNNLARLIHDPGALPSFSFANQSGTNVTDQGNVGATTGWSRGSGGIAPFLFNSVGGSLGMQRSEQESFTLTPVNDPRRLELMRCAYQKVLAGAGLATVSGTCPDCQNRFNVFYTGDENGDINAKSKGAVTSDCLNGGAWFGWGPKKCVPKQCCSIVGCYCDCYVWVLPGQHEQLAKLTIAILDYAMSPAPVSLTKTVVYYLDEQGLPTTQASAVGAVTGTINVNERNESLLNLPLAAEAELRDKLQHQLFDLEQHIALLPHVNQAGANREDLRRRNDLLAQRDRIEAQLRYLKIQMEVGGLKQEYTRSPQFGAGPAASFAPSSNAIWTGQTLNLLAPPSTLPGP